LSSRGATVNQEDTMLEQFFERLTTLRDVLVHELKDMYDAENQIIETLPTMIEKATHPDLVRALSDHFQVTKSHAKRLEEVFGIFGLQPTRATCAGMQGILSEGSSCLSKVSERGAVMDAVIIAATQKVEHYEISGYGTLVAFAQTTGETGAAALLQKNLGEEKEADALLTKIAKQRSVNERATTGDRAAARPPRDRTTR